MAQVDSVDKIITRYFSLVCAEEFTYKGVVYTPKPIKVSPLLFRDYKCPAGCGGCCPRFSLDYLPGDEFPYELEQRKVLFNGKGYSVYSDTQEDHRNYHCRNLSMKDGRCGIHTRRPFSCDFELIRALAFEDKNTPNVLTQKLFGRGWALKRIDGNRGALCEMTPITDQSIDEVIRKIKALERWCNHFELKNKCGRILQWINDVRPFLKFRQIKPAIL
jgi:Fe-S-cluster containining protein